ncbi:hypothetical protein ISF6_5404 [Piscinibacter sakaiensis]|uniref:Uncharacterized protein n=1 Tax=Piscinibacter sakaiensis TaxID=1547922 RepID=A0A0K8NWE8_PISS1|nr:hypothetical protein ISF6_5404 [Piscinibacter sakaiensis]
MAHFSSGRASVSYSEISGCCSAAEDFTPENSLPYHGNLFVSPCFS